MALDTALVGGSGGAGADTSGFVAGPYGGGGALQLTAMGSLEFAGIATVGGGGGRTPDGNWRNGAGGAVYLEAPLITIAAADTTWHGWGLRPPRP